MSNIVLWPFGQLLSRITGSKAELTQMYTIEFVDGYDDCRFRVDGLLSSTLTT